MANRCRLPTSQNSTPGCTTASPWPVTRVAQLAPVGLLSPCASLLILIPALVAGAASEPLSSHYPWLRHLERHRLSVPCDSSSQGHKNLPGDSRAILHDLHPGIRSTYVHKILRPVRTSFETIPTALSKRAQRAQEGKNPKNASWFLIWAHCCCLCRQFAVRTRGPCP